MLRKLRERAQEEKGFTLIELLVVILIIGILAAIAIPSFLNQRNKGQDAEAKAGAKTAAEAEETYFTDNQSYTATPSDLVNVEATLSNANNLAAAAASGGAIATSYRVTVDSDSGNSFWIQRVASGAISRDCTTHGTGGCRSTAIRGSYW